MVVAPGTLCHDRAQGVVKGARIGPWAPTVRQVMLMKLEAAVECPRDLLTGLCNREARKLAIGGIQR